MINEYERTSTTVINAYVRPIVEHYLSRLIARARAHRHRRPAAADAVEWRADHRQGRGRDPDAHHRMRAGGRGRRRAGADPANRHREGDLVRHGRHHRQGLDHRERRGDAAPPNIRSAAGIMLGSRLLSGAGYTLKVPAIDLAEVGAGGGSISADRCRRRVAGRAAQRRRVARPGRATIPGRDRADRDRRQCRARLSQSRPSGWRRGQAQRRQGAVRSSPSGSPVRSA